MSSLHWGWMPGVSAPRQLWARPAGTRCPGQGAMKTVGLPLPKWVGWVPAEPHSSSSSSGILLNSKLLTMGVALIQAARCPPVLPLCSLKPKKQLALQFPSGCRRRLGLSSPVLS